MATLLLLAAAYIVPIAPHVRVVPILTAGESVNGYRMVGIPDGLGAFDNGDGTFTVLMNHEIMPGLGVRRAHGAAGAFVSKWIIRKSDFRVLHGEDLIRRVALWNPSTGAYNAPALDIQLARLCSADLAPPSAFFDETTGAGTRARIYTNGEELSPIGRAFAHLLDGTSYELARLGRASWEQVTAHPSAGERTIVALTDDSPGGQVYFYVGRKQHDGIDVERAGLTNGTRFALSVDGFLGEPAESGIPAGTRFTLRAGAEGTHFQRPEDGAWDPNRPNDFWFTTTATFEGRTRLWRVRFDDISDPTRGGTIEMMLDGTEGLRSLDNLVVTGSGDVILQEDPGVQPHLARVVRYVPSRDELIVLAEADPVRFGTGGVTIDEETSGVIDVSDILGEGWLLLDVQEHYPIEGELVQGGQLLALWYPPTSRRRSAATSPPARSRSAAAARPPLCHRVYECAIEERRPLAAALLEGHGFHSIAARRRETRHRPAAPQPRPAHHRGRPPRR